jgi:hypothetical protein
MAAIFNSLLVICLAFSTFTTSAREDSHASIEDAAYNIALQQYQSAKHALEKAIIHCENGRKPIPVDVISPLGLTTKQLKVALFILNSRAELHCEKGTREALFYAAGVYRATAKHYGKDPGDALQYDEDNMLSHVWKKLEFEAEYLRIDKETRFTLESMEATQVPFKIFETLDDLDRQ